MTDEIREEDVIKKLRLNPETVVANAEHYLKGDLKHKDATLKLIRSLIDVYNKAFDERPEGQEGVVGDMITAMAIVSTCVTSSRADDPQFRIDTVGLTSRLFAQTSMNIVEMELYAQAGVSSRVKLAVRAGDNKRGLSICPLCKSPGMEVAGRMVFSFNDMLSAKEYTISCLCQDCQDKVFNETEQKETIQ